MTAPLVRVSQLARFWELNPATVVGWIRSGRLAAIRSPGNHFRVRVADVRAFCEREGMPLPPFVAPPVRRVVAAALPQAARRALARALKAPGVALEAPDDPYDALVAAAASSPAPAPGAGGVAGATALVVLPAAHAGFDAPAAVAALRRAPGPVGAVPVVAFGAATRAQAAALADAGATHVLLRAQTDDLPGLARGLLGLP